MFKSKLSIILIITFLIITVLSSLYIYRKLNSVRFYSLEAKDLYIPKGFTLIKVDAPSENNTIWDTTLENKENNTIIVIMRYKKSKWNCLGKKEIMNNINYCMFDFENNDKINKAIKWDSNKMTFLLTTNDVNIPYNELLKLAQPFK